MKWWHVKTNTLINLERVNYIRCFLQPTENAGDVPTLRFFYDDNDFVSITFDSPKDMGDCFQEIKKVLDGYTLGNTP